MSSALESLVQQYAAESMRKDADEKLPKRLEREIRVLEGVTEHADQREARMHVQSF